MQRSHMVCKLMGFPFNNVQMGGEFWSGKSLAAASGAIIYGVTDGVFNQCELDKIKKYYFYSNQFLKERMALRAFKWLNYLKPKRFQIAEI